MSVRTEHRRRRGWLWAAAGVAVVLVAGGLVVGLALRPASTPTSEPSEPTSTGSTPSRGATSPTTDLVDESATERGWVPEPITQEPATYAAAALAAAGSFDTTLSTHDEWLAYLEAWFTPDTRYRSSDDQADSVDAARLELRQSVVQPESAWESLAQESGRVTATVADDLRRQPVDDATDQSIWTGTITLEFTRSAPSGEETSYEEQARVSVQVLCGPGSVPTPGTAQAAGDCKVVRFFSEPIEG